jgi:CRP/FNR family transcriptional regulator, cyclic AMP receptor protein
LAILSENAIVGDFEMIEGLTRTSAAVALSDCDLKFISRSSFLECAKRHPEIYRYLSRLLARRLQETQQSIAAFAFLNAKGRLAHVLLAIAEHGGDKSGAKMVIPRIIGQRELAALAGVARENINRILRGWERRKLLTRLSNAYCINDKSELEREMAE